MEKKLNNIFEIYNINAECIRYSKIDSYQFYECYLKNNGKISDIKSIQNELQFYLQLPNINIKFLPEDSIIRIESFSSSKKIDYDSIIGQRKNSTQCFLGKDYYGSVVSIDLEECPHLLIGGSTGSGKTVLVNTIIRNLLETGVGLYLCDPKRIEFNKYETDNSVINVSYDKDSIIQTIEYLHNLMESNYGLIKKYGSSVVKSNFLIIDEYADIASYDDDKKIRNGICSLAQKARAAKIHIILATQRPSVNIIDGDIKANFPSRIALKTASSFDSKTILDEIGAEKLLGKGDAIFKDSFGNKIRFQTAI